MRPESCVSKMYLEIIMRDRMNDSVTHSASRYFVSCRCFASARPDRPGFESLLSLPLLSVRTFRSSLFGQVYDRLVTVSSVHCCTSTSALSTLSSSRGLKRYLILRGASRLDAFSVYPFPTWLLCYALGSTTDAPEVSPSRSSRTKDSSPQISNARAG